MFLKYANKLYEVIYCCLVDKDVISTYCKEKTDNTFYSVSDYYAKDFVITDPDIQDIYDINFYVDYIDEKQTMKLMRGVTRWCVNDNRPMHKAPEIEKDELGIQGPGMNSTDGWVVYDQGASSKIIHLSDCTGFIVEYKYTVKDGKVLEKKLVEEVRMNAEEFKAEMIKHRPENV
ncbi:MAG: hypothetical protein IJF37_08815 [Lachnospiraceae bacterium]|nr:hypothetical protein [Lachnospiraceae bacterium]